MKTSCLTTAHAVGAGVTVTDVLRLSIELRGIVQGVGFRPHVVRQAERFGISGFCGNDDQAVFVEAEGPAAAVRRFQEALVTQAPPLAAIDQVSVTEIPLQGQTDFAIVPSRRVEGQRTLVPPDGGCCRDCEIELHDPTNRRFRYPFISCTNCGPRLSIIEDLPYDRPLTTLAPFPLCDTCRSEYEDPADRRFHAQPIGCFDCGPTLSLTKEGTALARGNRSAVAAAREALRQGQILAVKGLGGYTLMADATDKDTVALLRTRKHRPHKPFAVMSLMPEELGQFSSAALTAARSSARPVVLAPRRPDAPLAPNVAPGLQQIGVMMPSMGTHYLLCEGMPPLIATSGNLSGEPLFADDDQAQGGLGGIADAFLSYDREICHPLEDSVVAQCIDGTVKTVRRGRGLTPRSLLMNTGAVSVMAVGGELKNAFTFTRDGRAFPGPHLGDMASLRAQQLLENLVHRWGNLHRRQPDLLVADLHPDYATTRWAQRQDLPLLQVQHHHAHALSLMAELQISKSAVIAVLDGTGYAPDGTIWGAEFLRFEEDPLHPVRDGHLPPFLLPGGDHAIRHPWRVAAGLLHSWHIEGADLLPTGAEADLTYGMLESEVGTVPTTSMGRYFDAAAALLGVHRDISYDAQGPIELEALATNVVGHKIAADPVSLIAEIVDRIRAGIGAAQLAADFHVSIAHWVSQTLVRLAETNNLRRVGLTGGVADNLTLTHLIRSELQQNGYALLTQALVPSNDGGLSLGQAYAGHLWARRGGDIHVLGNPGTHP